MKKVFRGKQLLAGALAIIVAATAIPLPAAASVKRDSYVGEIAVNPANHYQTLEGWGTSLCWWGNAIGSGDKDYNKNGRPDREEIAELAFSPEYLNLNIVRYNVGGGDKQDSSIKRIEGKVPGWSKDMLGNEDGSGEFLAESFYNKPTEEMNDAGQIWMMEQANRYRQEKGDIINEVFSNSPPYYMTKSGSSTGGYENDRENLKSENYDDFALYMARAAKWLDKNLNAKFGTRVDYIEPMNEPDTMYWVNGSTKQEGCSFWMGASQTAMIKEMSKALTNEGLNHVKLTGTDETGLDKAINAFHDLDAEAKKSLNTIGAHTYNGTDKEREELKKIADSYDKKLWMSEVTRGGNGHWDGSHDSMAAVNAKDQSHGIMSDLKKMQSSAWIAWLVADSEYECIQTDSNWGLLHYVFEKDGPVKDYHTNLFNEDGSVKGNVPKEGYWAVTKQFYTMMQYSKYLKAGYTMIEIGDDNMCAAISPDRTELVIVAQNFGENRDTTIDLNAFKHAESAKLYRTSDKESCELIETQSIKNHVLQVSLPTNSVSTYVITAKESSDLGYAADYSQIIPRDVRTSDETVAAGASNLNKFTYTGDWDFSGQWGEEIYTTNKEAKVSFKFDGTQGIIYGKTSEKAANLTVSIDGGAAQSVSTADSEEKRGSVLYATPLLEKGVHTIDIGMAEGTQPNGAEIVIEFAKIVQGELLKEVPKIISIQNHDKGMTVQLEGIKDFSNYEIIYGTKKDELNQRVTAVDNRAFLTGLTNGETYYVQAITENGADKRKSNIVTSVPQIPNDNVCYFVNAGTAHPYDSIEEETFGNYNSVMDQIYGVDRITGKQWGYVGTNNGTHDTEDGSRFGSVRYDTSNNEGLGINYKFELEKGEYNILIGMKDPWPNENRKQDIVIQGDTKDTNLIPNEQELLRSYQTKMNANGTLEIGIVRSSGNNGDNEDPLVSFIKIEKIAEKPVFTEEQLKENDYLMYLANCGTPDKMQIPTGFKKGLCQSVFDQEFAKDSKGFSWGYAKADTNSDVRQGGDNALNLSESYAYMASDITFDKHKTGIKYSFELPDESKDYKVVVGFENPWDTRNVDIRIEDNTVETAYELTQGKRLEKEYIVPVSDGMLDVFIHNPNRQEASGDPLVNYMMIKAVPTYSNQMLSDALEEMKKEMNGKLYGDASMEVFNKAKGDAKALIEAQENDNKKLTKAYLSLEDAYKNLKKKYHYTSFSGNEGAPIYDNNGVQIQAHGGQIQQLTVDGVTKYYWIGEDKTNDYRPVGGIHMYSSQDLYNWTDEGVVLKTMESKEEFETDPYFKELYGDYTQEKKDAIFIDLDKNKCVIERPKMIYNEKTKKHVIWFHADGRTPQYPDADYGKANAGIAIADSPKGPFKLLGSYDLNYVEDADQGYDGDNLGSVRDMNLFVDDDKTAYIIYSSQGNRTTFISKLNEEYTDLAVPRDEAVEGVHFTTNFEGWSREAPAMFKFQNKYFMITSGCTGWSPNPAKYAIADSPMGPWTDMGDPCEGENSNTTFYTQSTCVFPVDAKAGKFIYMGDRWNAGDLSESRYVWLPIEFLSGEELVLKPYTDWTLEALDGKGLLEVETKLPEKCASLSELESLLPKKLDIRSGDTIIKETPVEWEHFDSSKSYMGEFVIKGKLTAFNRIISHTAAIMDEKTAYFFDCANGNSEFFDKVKGKLPKLINKVSDQAYTEENGAGYTGTVGTDMDVHSGGNTFEQGWYAKSGKAIEYAFSLEAGDYTVFTGYQEWWSSTRDMKIKVLAENADGSTFTLAEKDVQLEDWNKAMVQDVKFTVPNGNTKPIKIRIEKRGDADPVLSYIGIADNREAISYAITVNKGTASKSIAAAGESIDITANAAPEGKIFDQWTVVSGGAILIDAKASSTKFTMPASNVEITAEYKDRADNYNVMVINGAADKNTAKAGETVKITANAAPEGKLFDEWKVVSGGAILIDAKASSTTFTMPASDVEITAMYRDNIKEDSAVPPYKQEQPIVNVVNENVIDKAIKKGDTSIIFEGKTGEGGKLTISITKEARDKILSNGVENIILMDKNVKIVLSDKAIRKIVRTTNEDVTITVEQVKEDKIPENVIKALQGKPMYDFKVTYQKVVNGHKVTKTITKYDKEAITISIPYKKLSKEKADNLYAVYISEKGEITYLKDSTYNILTGSIEFKTNHLSYYAVAYVEKPALRFVEKTIKMTKGQSYFFAVDAYGFNVNTITWKTTKKKAATVGKNAGKIRVEVTAVSKGQDYLQVSGTDLKGNAIILRLKLIVE